MSLFRKSCVSRILKSAIRIFALFIAFAIAFLGTANFAHAQNPIYSLTSKDNLQDSWDAKDLKELPKEQIHFKQNYSWKEHSEVTGSGASKLQMVKNKDGNNVYITKSKVDMSNKSENNLINSAEPVILTIKGVAFDDDKKDINLKITFSNAELYSHSSASNPVRVNPALFNVSDKYIGIVGNIIRHTTTTDGKNLYFFSKLTSEEKKELKAQDVDDDGVSVTEYITGLAQSVTTYSYKVDLVYTDSGLNVPDSKTLFTTYTDCDIDGESTMISKASLTDRNLQNSMFFYEQGLSNNKTIINQHKFTSDAAKNKTLANALTSRNILKDRTVIADKNVREYFEHDAAYASEDNTGDNLYILGTSGMGNSPTFNANHYNATGQTCNISTGGSYYDLDGNLIKNSLLHDSPYVYHNDYHYCGHSKEITPYDAVTSGWTLTLKPHTGTIKQVQPWYTGSLILQQIPPRTITAKVLSGQGEIVDTDMAGTSYKADGSKNTTSTKVYWKHDQKFTVKPAQYYRIKSVKSGEGSTITNTSATDKISVSNPLGSVDYTFAAVTSNKQIVAEFERIPAQLNITKKANSFEYAPGDTVTYTIETTDTTASSAAYNLKVTDVVPSDLEVKSVSASGVDGATATHNGNNVTATAPLLPHGSKLTLTITATVKSSATGKIVANTASATCDNPGSNNPVEATDNIWVNDSRMTVTKAADKYEYHVGEVAHFTIGLHDKLNNSGTIAKNVVLTDVQAPEQFKIDMNSIKVSGVPASVNYPVDDGANKKTESRENKYTIQPNASGSGFTITIPYLPGNASVTVTYDAIASTDINGLDAINHASVKTDNPQDPGDETTTRIWVNDAKLRINKTTETFEHKVGDVAEYTLSVSNVAAKTVASNVVVKDVSLPKGAVLLPGSLSITGISNPVNYPVLTANSTSQTFESRANVASAKYADGSECPLSIGQAATGFDTTASAVGGNGFILTIPYLQSDDVATIKYSVRFDAEVNGTVVKNKATVSCDNPSNDWPSEELEDDEDVFVNSPDIEVEKTTSTPSVRPGEDAHYKIVVKNKAEGTIAGIPVEIIDSLPVDVNVLGDSFKVTGADGKISYPVRTTKESENGKNTTQTTFEEKQNKFRLAVASGESLFENDKIANAEQPSTDTSGLNSLFIMVDYIPGGSEIVIEYSASIQTDAAGKLIRNVVTVNDPKSPEPKQDEETVHVQTEKHGYQTTLYKASNPGSGSLVKVGDEIEYSLTLKNTGKDVAAFTHIRDYVPAGTVFKSVSNNGVFVENKQSTVVSSTQISASSDSGNGYVEWVISNLSPNEEVTVTYKVQVQANVSQLAIDPKNMFLDYDVEDSNNNNNANDNADAEQKLGEQQFNLVLPLYIRNAALYESLDETPGSPGEIDKNRLPGKESNEVIHSTDENHPAPAVIDVEKVSDPPSNSVVSNKTNIKYSLIIKNNGGTEAKSVYIRDYIDEKLMVNVSSIDSNGKYDDSRRMIEWLIDSVAPGAEITVSYMTSVTGCIPGDVIRNQALFDWDWGVGSNTISSDPRNSTNIVEHISNGDGIVADDPIYQQEMFLVQTGAIVPTIITLLLIVSPIAFFAVRKSRRDEDQARIR